MEKKYIFFIKIFLIHSMHAETECLIKGIVTIEVVEPSLIKPTKTESSDNQDHDHYDINQKNDSPELYEPIA